jgi:hypothetical protein
VRDAVRLAEAALRKRYDGSTLQSCYGAGIQFGYWFPPQPSMSDPQPEESAMARRVHMPSFKNRVAKLAEAEAKCPNCEAARKLSEGVLVPPVCELHQYARRRLALPRTSFPKTTTNPRPSSRARRRSA